MSERFSFLGVCFLGTRVQVVVKSDYHGANARRKTSSHHNALPIAFELLCGTSIAYVCKCMLIYTRFPKDPEFERPFHFRFIFDCAVTRRLVP